MFFLRCRTLLRVKSSSATSTRFAIPALHFLRVHWFSSSDPSNQHSFTVSYLINACGLSEERALSASKTIKFETPDRPDAVISFFRGHGFSDAQISVLIQKQPRLLLADPKKTFLPKFEFFDSLGISKNKLADELSKGPRVLCLSLKNNIIPCFKLLRDLLPSDASAAAVFKHLPGIMRRHYNESRMFLNVQTLRQHGVPESNISFMLTYAGVLYHKEKQFKEIVESVKIMGFDPSTIMFVKAVLAMGTISKSMWKRKREVCKKWGWSDEDLRLAFRRKPWFICTSEKKIMAVMDFCVNTLGWEPTLVAHNPIILTLSLEKRIIPRCSVLQALLSKGLINECASMTKLLLESEGSFLQNFVNCYGEEAPQLLALYRDKMGLQK